MNRIFTALNKSNTGISRNPGDGTPARSDYAELIARIFQGPGVVALVCSDSGVAAKNVCNEVATELGQSGKRVVVVSVQKVLRMAPIPSPDASEFVPVAPRNLWHWPSQGGPQIDFFKSRAWPDEGNWLDSLRNHFDSVLLDCPELESSPGAAAIAAMADATVIVVEAGQTPKQRVVLDLRTLRLNHACVVGSVLINGN